MTDSSAPPNSASRKHPNSNLARGIDELDALEVSGGSIGIRKPSLDDAFLALTGESAASAAMRAEAVR